MALQAVNTRSFFSSYVTITMILITDNWQLTQRQLDCSLEGLIHLSMSRFTCCQGWWGCCCILSCGVTQLLSWLLALHISWPGLAASHSTCLVFGSESPSSALCPAASPPPRSCSSVPSMHSQNHSFIGKAAAGLSSPWHTHTVCPVQIFMLKIFHCPQKYIAQDEISIPPS